MSEEMKTCSVCHTPQPSTNFNRNRTSWDGHDNRCKTCLKAYRQSDAYRAANRARGERNYADPVKRERMKTSSRNYLAGLKEAASEANSDVIARAEAIEQLKRLEDSSKEASKRWREEHPERAREVSRVNYRKWRGDPRNHLSSNVSSLIRNSMSAGMRAGRHWETLLPYAIDELKAHLESLWEPGMNWDNHTKDGWHIDHVRPVSSFSFNSPEDQGFKDCWALSNLMPRWATNEIAKRQGSTQIGNLNKNDRVIASQAPALESPPQA
jgi:hypothetical protein